MSSLIESLSASLRDDTFLRLTLSQPIPATKGGGPKVTIRPVLLRDETKYQWTSRTGSQEHHENLTAAELQQRVAAVFCITFADAHLFTTVEDLSFKQHRSGQVRFKKSKPTLKAAADLNHNREKQYLIPAGVPCPFLIEIGVMLPNGQVRSAMYHKFRQINRYLEFVEDLLPNLPAEGTLNIVDFGCGKSYLTFALHHLLTRIHRRDVSIVGLDVKQEVIADCSRIARILGSVGLHFEVGRIESFQPSEHVHLAVSLHACDTATDDAIAGAIRWQCEAILAVPCCQHELNETLEARVLPGITQYGIFRERFAAMATDALRARFLDAHGYRTQMLEFIDMEHTPKNVLLRAIRRNSSTAAEVEARQRDYDQLKADLALKDWHLERVSG
ncbi:MAG: SAM-dependent methyltransferase [Planctomycetes bacterium]|nr:SAM-dependent methyltransferase [Planctomycetota bacterium]